MAKVGHDYSHMLWLVCFFFVLCVCVFPKDESFVHLFVPLGIDSPLGIE